MQKEKNNYKMREDGALCEDSMMENLLLVSTFNTVASSHHGTQERGN
jgi:hypothetical protein